MNKVPARAKVLIGRVVHDVREAYTIDYRANAERMSISIFFSFWGGGFFKLLIILCCYCVGIEDVKAMCEKEMPDVLVRVC